MSCLWGQQPCSGSADLSQAHFRSLDVEANQSLLSAAPRGRRRFSHRVPDHRHREAKARVQSHTAAKQRGAECKPRQYGSSLRAPNFEATLSFQAPTLQALAGRWAGTRALWEKL